MKFGIYRLHEPIEPETLAAIERQLGRPIDLISVYRAWNRCDLDDDIQWLANLKRSSRDILLTWEPWRSDAHGEQVHHQPDFSLERIAAGQFDHYIGAFGHYLSGFKQTIYLRPMHEMNGNWYPWCGAVNGNSADLYTYTWRHLHRIVSKESGATLRWVWSPYAQSFPAVSANAIERYFPGDDVVDWLGIDGYNWGTAKPGTDWQSFAQIFDAAYRTLTALSRKPLMIAETACNETGGDKAAWIQQAFTDLQTTYTRIRMLVWFDINKECNWTLSNGDAQCSRGGSRKGPLRRVDPVD